MTTVGPPDTSPTRQWNSNPAWSHETPHPGAIVTDGSVQAPPGAITVTLRRPQSAQAPSTTIVITQRALAEGSVFTAGVELPGSDPAEVRVLHQLGYRALLAVGVFDGERGYLVEIYFDSDHTELVAVAPHARVLEHYCVRNVTAGPDSTGPA